MASRISLHFRQNSTFNNVRKQVCTQSRGSNALYANSAVLKSHNSYHPKCAIANNFSSTSSHKDISDKMPKYTLFREDGAFSLKPNPPTMRKIENTVNISKKGRLSFSFTPRVVDNSRLGNMLNWPDTLSVSIGVEDIGKILFGLSKHKPIHFSFPSKNGDGDNGSRNLIIEPYQDGTCKIMFVYGEVERKIVLTLGELLVLKSFFINSIPQLVGWNTLMNLSLNDNISSVL